MVRATTIVCLGFGAAIFAVLTFAPPAGRGVLVVLIALLLLALRWRHPHDIVIATVLTLVVSEDTSNRLADVFDRAQFGSVWAASVAGRVTASDGLAAIAVLCGVRSYRRVEVRRVSRFDVLLLGLAALLAYGALGGLAGRLPIEDWRFWLFDLRAAIYMSGGYVIARTLIGSQHRDVVVHGFLFAFAVVFAITAAQFVAFPTGYQTLYGTPILIVSETALLVAVFVLVGAALVTGTTWWPIVGWAVSSAFMIVVDFVSGRRTALGMVAAALIVLIAISGRASFRLAVALAAATLTCALLAYAFSPRAMQAGFETVTATIAIIGRASLTPSASASAPTPTAATLASATALPTATGLPTATATLMPVDSTASGVGTRAGEMANVAATLERRGAIWFGLGFGRVWEVIHPQPDDFFAVGPRSGLYGTPYRFNLHVPGLDYLLRYGVIGTVLWVLWGAWALGAVLRWRSPPRHRVLGLATLCATFLMLAFWGNPRTHLIEGLMLGLVRVVEAGPPATVAIPDGSRPAMWCTTGSELTLGA